MVFYFVKGGKGFSYGYTYYRFRVPKINSGTSNLVENIQFRWDGSWQTNSMTASSTGTIGLIECTVTASAELSSSFAGWKAFDATSDSWQSGFDTYDGSQNEIGEQWVKIEFQTGGGKVITGMKVVGNGSFYPVDFYLQGSNNNSTWTTIPGSSQTGQNTSTEQTYTW